MQPELFDAHLAYLCEHAYTPLTAAQLVRLLDDPDHLPSKPVVITFDDGFADFYTSTFPILQKYAFPASLYVVSGFLGKTSQWLKAEGEENRLMLDRSQIGRLSAAGIEIGAHTHTHADLDVLDTGTARQEMQLSKDILEEATGQPVTTFAYPYGHFDRKIRSMAQEVGFLGACAVKRGLSHTRDDRFALARLEITNTTDVSRLETMLAGKGVPLASPQETVLQWTWRIVRRMRHSFG